MYPPVLVTPPSANDPLVTLVEAKAHCHVDTSATDWDTYLPGLVSTAVSRLDGWAGILGRCLITQTWRQDFDVWCKALRLPFPAATISSVKVRNSAGQLSTVDSADYDLRHDFRGSYVRMKDDYDFPGDLAETQAIAVEFTAGYGAAAAVPPAIKHAVLLMVGHWFENREASSAEGFEAIPFGVDALIEPFRLKKV